MKKEAIVVAAGKSQRCGEDKLYFSIKGKPLIFYTLERIISVFNSSILVCAKDKLAWWKDVPFALKVVAGGAERQDSVSAGFSALDEDTDLVLIHDGARPFVKECLIEKVIEEAEKTGAAVAGLPVTETIKQVEDLWVKQTVNRDNIWSIQTPQAFKREIIVSAYSQGYKDGFFGTDCASLVERAGFAVKIVLGDKRNIKVTTQDDLIMAER
ncbi:2-C-methyl-D-erythritol 4-phosphate cytidylyltransferase, partial [bacterium]|nr:2-C-methyl-D-erythritol 4-phosphate cytidylyltransferase [bacterium]MBU1599356.1 2-C-methyl-D-erythritol 4-phosphate cytidylyltransferase [bacterium]